MRNRSGFIKEVVLFVAVVLLTGTLTLFAGCSSHGVADNSTETSNSQRNSERAVAPEGRVSLPATRGEFLSRTFKVGKEPYPYQIYLPAGDAANGKRPVILFLHGSGERGSDGQRQTEIGLGPAIRSDPAQFPFIVVFPQCREGLTWLDPRMEALTLGALDEAVHAYGGDEERLYLTGVSMGGVGAWQLAARYPGKFAAVVPVSGRSPLRGISKDPEGEIAKRIGKIPVWVFHGSEDRQVGVEGSRRIVAALRQSGSSVKYTEYASVGHNSWDRAYAEPELVAWLLSHRIKR